MSYSDKQDFVVIADDHNIRLDRWFKLYFPEINNANLQKLLRKKFILLNNKKATHNQKIFKNDIINIAKFICIKNKENLETEVREKRASYSDKDVEDLFLSILYKDENVIIINKKQGLAVQSGTNVSFSLDDMLSHLKFDYDVLPRLVHRIDKETSGIVILARSREVANLLADQFAGKEIKKKYVAITYNNFAKELGGKDKGIIDIDLYKKIHNKNTEKKQEIAQTKYRVIKNFNGIFSMVEFMPITGRMHQIRKHAMLVGCPILGDKKYDYGIEISDKQLDFINILDGKYKNISTQLHLHSIQVDFAIKGKEISVSAPIPEHIARTEDFLTNG